jgi:hypothetical protein
VAARVNETLLVHPGHPPVPAGQYSVLDDSEVDETKVDIVRVPQLPGIPPGDLQSALGELIDDLEEKVRTDGDHEDRAKDDREQPCEDE